MMLILRMFLSFGWRSWCNFLRTLNGIVVLYLHNSLAGVCGGIFTIGEIQPGANPLVGSASGKSRWRCSVAFSINFLYAVHCHTPFVIGITEIVDDGLSKCFCKTSCFQSLLFQFHFVSICPGYRYCVGCWLHCVGFAKSFQYITFNLLI